MSNIPKVGIALLAYNQGKYIDEAIESLRKQTFQDYEVLLIDDGSNDGFTPEKLESIQFEKISKKFLHKTNIGGPKRRKQYDEKMQNEYILNFCGDDILAPTFLEKTVAFLDHNPKYGAVCTNLKIVDENNVHAAYEHKYDKDTMCFPDMLISCNMLGSSLIRRKALDGINLEWPLRRYYDWNRWNAMLNAGWKLGLVPESLFYYRQVEGSLSHSGNKEDDIAFRKELIKRYGDIYKKYYQEIIIQLYSRMAELQEGRDWLDAQYNNMQKEIERLNNEVQLYKNESAWQQLKRNFKNRHQEKK